jgi:hypothetical protein
MTFCSSLCKIELALLLHLAGCRFITFLVSKANKFCLDREAVKSVGLRKDSSYFAFDKYKK